MIAFKKKLINYVMYNLVDKWKFIYLELELNDYIFSLENTNDSLVVRVAERNDVDKIKEDIYPQLGPAEENDKKYIERIGDDDFTCFIVEKDGCIIHYFLIFEKALNSPLAKTPFNMSLIKENDAYLGTAFTAPKARGLWVVPISLSAILKYLRDSAKCKKVYVLVHKDTPGAKDFYVKLGFDVVTNKN